MNRLALHASTGPGLSVTDLVRTAAASGFESIGLRVGGAAEFDDRWQKGIGSPELHAAIDALLTTRVSVLDVGRAALTAGAQGTDRVLDFAVRLGAHWVTAAPGPADTVEDVQAAFSRFSTQCASSNMIALLVPTPETAAADPGIALDLARTAHGGVVVNVHTAMDPDELDSLLLDGGNAIGYVRVQGTDLDELAHDMDDVPPLLATLPVHIPVAVGDDTASHEIDREALTIRARRWRTVVDRLLEHPKAKAARLAGT